MPSRCAEESCSPLLPVQAGNSQGCQTSASICSFHIAEGRTLCVTHTGLGKPCCCACRAEQDGQWRQRTSRMGAAAAGERRWPGCCALALLVWQDLLLIANAGGNGLCSKAFPGGMGFLHMQGCAQSLTALALCRACLHCACLQGSDVPEISSVCRCTWVSGMEMCILYLLGLPALQGTAGQCCAGQAKRCS